MADVHVMHNRGGRKPVARTFDDFVDIGRGVQSLATDTPAAHAILSMWDLGRAAFWQGMPHHQMLEHTCPAFREGWWTAHCLVRQIGGTYV